MMPMETNHPFARVRVYVSPCAREVRLTSAQILCNSVSGTGSTENYSEITLDWDD